jgi:hypothetical protein
MLMERDLASAGQRPHHGQLGGLPHPSTPIRHFLSRRDSHELQLLGRQFDHGRKGWLRLQCSHGGLGCSLCYDRRSGNPVVAGLRTVRVGRSRILRDGAVDVRDPVPDPQISQGLCWGALGLRQCLAPQSRRARRRGCTTASCPCNPSTTVRNSPEFKANQTSYFSPRHSRESARYSGSTRGHCPWCRNKGRSEVHSRAGERSADSDHARLRNRETGQTRHLP